MMDMKRIEELAALPLPGVIASTPDEYERRRTIFVINLALNEFAAEAIVDMVRPGEEAGNEGIARAVAQKRIRDLLP